MHGSAPACGAGRPCLEGADHQLPAHGAPQRPLECGWPIGSTPASEPLFANRRRQSALPPGGVGDGRARLPRALQRSNNAAFARTANARPQYNVCTATGPLLRHAAGRVLLAAPCSDTDQPPSTSEGQSGPCHHIIPITVAAALKTASNCVPAPARAHERVRTQLRPQQPARGGERLSCCPSTCVRTHPSCVFGSSPSHTRNLCRALLRSHRAAPYCH